MPSPLIGITFRDEFVDALAAEGRRIERALTNESLREMDTAVLEQRDRGLAFCRFVVEVKVLGRDELAFHAVVKRAVALLKLEVD